MQQQEEPIMTLTAKWIALTYSQALELDRETLREHLMNALPFEPEEMTIGQELHKDGGTHYHVAMMYQKKQLFNPTLFDWDDDVNNIHYHPNVVTMKTKRDYVHWSKYCVKEDPTPIIFNKVMMIVYNSRLGGLNNAWDIESDDD